MASSSATAGSGWPERHRSHFERLGARLRPTLGTAEPSARPDRGKWLQGSPAESGAHGRCRVLQAAAPCARKLCDTEKTLGEKVVIHTQAVPGSHQALPGTLGGALHGARRAPTADGRPRRISRGGKRVMEFRLCFKALTLTCPDFYRPRRPPTSGRSGGRRRRPRGSLVAPDGSPASSKCE